MKSQFSAKLKLFFCFLDEIRQNLNNYKKLVFISRRGATDLIEFTDKNSSDAFQQLNKGLTAHPNKINFRKFLYQKMHLGELILYGRW